MIPIIIIVVVIVVIVLIIIVITTTTTTTTIIIIIIIRGLDPGSPHRQPQRRVPRRGRWQFSSAWEQGICLVGNGGNGMIVTSYCGSFPHSLRLAPVEQLKI